MPATKINRTASGKPVIQRAAAGAVEVIPVRGVLQVPAPVDNAVAQLLADGATLSGAELAAFLGLKVTLPGGGSGYNALIKDPVTGAVVWGVVQGSLSQTITGTLQATVARAQIAEQVIVEGGGFGNTIVGPDPAVAAQVGGVLQAGGDVYGPYASDDKASSWRGGNDGHTAVTDQKTISIEPSRTSPNVSYIFSSNYNGTNPTAVLSKLWKQTWEPSTRRYTAVKLFDSATGTGTNLYRCLGDGNNHPRQTGRFIVTDPLRDGRGWLCHADGVVQFTEGGTVDLKALNGAATKNLCYGMVLDPTKDPATGIDLLVAVAAGTDAGVWRIANAQLPGVAGSGGGPTATKLTGGSAPSQPLGIAAFTHGGVTKLLVTDGGLSGTPGGLRLWNGTTWSDVTPTGLTPSSGLPGFPGGLAGGIPTPAGGVINTGVVICKAIDAYVVGGNVYAVMGHDGPDQQNMSKVWWTQDALTVGSWHFHVNADNLASFPQKGSGKLWWLPNAPNGPAYTYFAMTYDKGGYDASAVWIDRTDPTKMYAIGRSGVWYIDNTITATPKCQPADNGLGAAIAYSVAFHPTNPLIALASDSDWTGFHFLNIANEPRLLQHTSGSPALPPNVDGRDVRFDTLGGGYVALAQRATFDNGDVWYTPDTTSSTSWFSLMHGNNTGLSAWTDFGVRGLALQLHTDGDVVLLANIGPKISTSSSPTAGDPLHAGVWQLKGLWNAGTSRFEHAGVASVWTRKSSVLSDLTTAYQQVKGAAGKTAADAGKFAFYDPITQGLMRSLDYGATWDVVFPRHPQSVYRYGGAVAFDKIVSDRVWLTIPGTGATPGELWRIDNFSSGTPNASLNNSGGTLSGTITATKVNVGTTGAALDCPGQIRCLNSGGVLVHQGVSGLTNTHAGIFKSTDAGTTWADIATDETRGLAQFVTGMDVSVDDQTLLLSCDGMGVVNHSLAPTTATYEVYTKPEVDALLAAIALGATLTDLNTVTGADGDFLERISGHWVNRTKAQVKADLSVQRAGIVSANAAMLPSATANTDGTPVTITIPTGYVGIGSCDFDYTTTGVSGETITVHFAVTYDDASTTNVSPTSTTNTTVNASASQRRTFRKQGRYITGMTVAVKSSIASSAASVAVNFIGEAI